MEPARMTRPELIKRTYYSGRASFFIRTVCGLLVSRPTASEALALYEEMETRWLDFLQELG
jgi:hypothetical protein